MIRGRRVGILVGFFLAIPLLQPLQPASQKTIIENATYALDTSSFRNIAILDVALREGGKNLEDQLIQAYLIADGQLKNFQELKTKESGFTRFTFVYKKDCSCQIYILNSTYQYPFLMKTLRF